MIGRELEYRCDTYNIELIVIDSILTPHKKHIQNDLKKLYKHRRKGHKITIESRSVFHNSYGYISIPDTDIITNYILKNKIIVIL